MCTMHDSIETHREGITTDDDIRKESKIADNVDDDDDDDDANDNNNNNRNNKNTRQQRKKRNTITEAHKIHNAMFNR